MDYRHFGKIFAQTVETDALLGLDAVPRADIAVEASPETIAPPSAAATSNRTGVDTPPARNDANQYQKRDYKPESRPQQGRSSSMYDAVNRYQPTNSKGFFDEKPDFEKEQSKMPRSKKLKVLEAMNEEEVKVCVNCPLSSGRTNTVFGEGDANAEIMFVGEGPGADEDRLGRPFVGRAGQLLEKMINAMGIGRDAVYIANIVKCRPPGNRVPTPDEAATCIHYLERQIEIIGPKAIVALGATSAKLLLNEPKLAITRERGKWRKYRGIDLMPTFHPAYLLRQYTVDNRKRVWSDLQAVMEHVGMEVPQDSKPE